MKNIIIFLEIILWGSLTWAQVDVRQGSYQEPFLDFIIKNAEMDIRLQRSYASRSLNKGWFGWGWCSNLENKLVVNSEDSIVYKDCELEMSFNKNQYNQWLSKDYPEAKLIRMATKYIFFGVSGEKLEFDLQGKILKFTDRSARSLSYKYGNSLFNKGSYILISSGEGFQLKFLKNNQDLVTEVSLHAPKALVIYREQEILRTKSWTFYYKYQDDNLVKVLEEKTNIYNYDYSNLRNLTKVLLENGQQKFIEYDEEMDCVTKVKDYEGCVEELAYWLNPLFPKDNYSTHYKKSCHGKLLLSGVYEFTYALHPLVGRYLKAMEVKTKNKVKVIKFNPISGRPIERKVSNHF
ncbi:MAG: hypothetical protein H6625_00775 [Bdellovibrionaceae bacterium]|nr:hypothetical protein [Pseudobdellovibrionaceae bacterium]